MRDEAYGDYPEVHKELYSKLSPHHGDVFYVLITRVALGKWVGTDKSSSSLQPEVFAFGGSNTKELADIPNHTPPTPHHSLVVCSAALRFREFILFHGPQLYPEYLVAYQRG
jgi:hypothetical protein